MKKIFLTVLSAFVLLASCNNLHFDDSTSISISLPLISDYSSSVENRAIQNFSGGYEYELKLIQNGKVRYRKKSAEGTNITFSRIGSGNYEIDCKAYGKERYDTLLFAKTLKNINVKPGVTNYITLDLTQVPVIIKQLQPSFMPQKQDTLYFDVLTDTYDSSVHIVNWYVNDELYDESEHSETYGFNKKGIQSISEKNSRITLKGPESSYSITANGYYKVYAEIVNTSNQDKVYTNVVDVYFHHNKWISVSSIVPTFKGNKNNVDINEEIDYSCFSGSVVFEVKEVYESETVIFNYSTLPEVVDVTPPEEKKEGKNTYVLSIVQSDVNNRILNSNYIDVDPTSYVITHTSQ